MRLVVVLLGAALVSCVGVQRVPRRDELVGENLPCGTFAGNWTDNYGLNWQLQQTDSTITGTLSDPTESYTSCVWNVLGDYDRSSGSFSLIINLVSDPNRTPDVYCVDNQFNGTVDKPGCNIAHGQSLRDDPPVDFKWQKPCEIPSGELTTPLGWSAGGAHMWNQILTSETGGDFTGRVVTESSPKDGVDDTCYFTKSEIPQLTHVQGSSWYVEQKNEWGFDNVGWSAKAVRYYRTKGRAPCGARAVQIMSIDCSDGDVPYVTNELLLGLDATTVTSSRAGQTATRKWP